MPSVTIYEDWLLDTEYDDYKTPVSEPEKPEKAACRCDDADTFTSKNYEHLAYDCSLSPEYIHYLYGPDTRPPSKFYTAATRAGLIGTYGTPQGSPHLQAASCPRGLSTLRSWTPPEEIAAHEIHGSDRGFYLNGSHVVFWPGTTTSLPRPANDTRQIQNFTHIPVQNPNPNLRNRPLASASDQVSQPQSPHTRPHAIIVSQNHNSLAIQENSGNTSNPMSTPASGLGPLTYHDPNLGPSEILKPGDIMANHYNWITPATRQEIEDQVTAAWTAARESGTSTEEKGRLGGLLRSMSDQVRNQEHLHIIRVEWLPRIWEWLTVRQTIPQGSPQWVTAMQNLASAKQSMNPADFEYISECIQAGQQQQAQAQLHVHSNGVSSDHSYGG